MQWINDHIFFYQQYFLKTWHNMTPSQYGTLLIAVAVIGWLTMKSGPR